MKRWPLIVLTSVLTACSLIDDNLAVCSVNQRINYQLQVHADVSMQLQSELNATEQESVRDALQSWLTPIFADENIDVDLRFFMALTDEPTVQKTEIIKKRRTSFSITLPKENFMHLAVANLNSSPQMQLSGVEHSATERLDIVGDGEMKSLGSSIYATRLPMEISGDSLQELEVELHMITSVVALVIDHTECPELLQTEGSVMGCAGGFGVVDSLFDYTNTLSFRMLDVPVSAKKLPAIRARREQTAAYRCLGVVAMPTQEEQEWQLTVVATLSGSRHTTNTMTVSTPLQAGELRILKTRMNKNGELSFDKDVSVSIELDWNEGGDHEIVL